MTGCMCDVHVVKSDVQLQYAAFEKLKLAIIALSQSVQLLSGTTE